MTYLNLPFEIPGYRIIRRLGLGGMATVYLAMQQSLMRPVAVKVLASERAPSDELVRRFEHEARTIARLDHPHIVSIYDVGRTSNGQIYYTMPYLPNGDLAARSLRDNPERVIQVMRALAEALGCAHDQGIVHRDVKPENVLFDKLDRPLLADFGIALSNSSLPRVTREGATIGSSGYMSPEQARGQPLDGRSDFYSLGVVCYELLTGEMPFRGGDALAVALAHIEKPVPRLPVTRRAWQPLIDRALAKHPDARFQSAEEMLAAIAVVEKRMQVPARIGLARWWRPPIERMLAVPRRQRALALCLLLLAALLGLLALLPRVPAPAAALARTAPASPHAGPPATMSAIAPVSAPAPAPATVQAPATAQAPVKATAPAAAAAHTGPVSLQGVTAGSASTAPTPALSAEEVARMQAAARKERLDRAAELVGSGRLAAPEGDSAARQYLAILAAEPRQRDALKGIARILGLLGARAASAIGDDDAGAAAAPIAQGFELAGRAHLASGPSFAAFVEPIHHAIEAQRAHRRDPFDIATLEKLKPLLPMLARIDPDGERALRADIERPAQLLRAGGSFRDPGGPSLVVIPVSRAAAAHLAQSFAIAVDEINRGAYARFAAASGRAPARCRASQSLLARFSSLDWRNPGFAQGDDHPAVCISWDDAAAYARWLSQRTGAHYRLPSQQEWLLAAQETGAGTSCKAANIGAHPDACDDGYPQTAPAGRFASSWPGVRDIAGNVSEWVDGCASGGLRSNACRERTFRGLSWRDDGDESNLVRTDTAASDVGYANVGFRLVRELPVDARAAQ
jgi:hypothetical protein